MAVQTIPGYTFGTAESARSPLSDEDFERLKQTVLFTEEDAAWLRKAGEVLADQIEDVLDLWYGFVGSHPFLLHYFTDREGKPIGDYLDRVRARFGQWIRDTCAARYDRAWLDYQQEIALRHTRAKKNRTDGVSAAADHIHLRYLIAFVYPITATIRSFLAKKGHSEEEVGKMHDAWFKSVVLQVALWSEPYARERYF
ncbi:MAG TPA: protoglobin domain-containing protein [Longimicrobiales bacterium]|nr:protoglobin domain-containing protein [Longimicrobiales bacterium]